MDRYEVRVRAGRAGQRVWVLVTAHNQNEFMTLEYNHAEAADDACRAMNHAARWKPEPE